MEEIIAVLQMPLAQKDHGSQKEKRQFEEVGESSGFIDLSWLNLEDTNAIDDFHGGPISPLESDDIDLVPPFGQGFCIPPDALVKCIESIGNHADSHCD